VLAKNVHPKGQLKLILDKCNKEEFRKIYLTNYTPELLKMALEMPKLNFLGIRFSWKCPIENLELPVNESVTAAAFEGFDPNLRSLIAEFGSHGNWRHRLDHVESCREKFTKTQEDLLWKYWDEEHCQHLQTIKAQKTSHQPEHRVDSKTTRN
jgi:hypothetical protein